MLITSKSTSDEVRAAARQIYQSDEIEIDTDAAVSPTEGRDGGTWVAAWVWVEHDDDTDATEKK